jgi:hypothetical protein
MYYSDDMSIYCFDLDNTLCVSDGDDYEKSSPIIERILSVNSLFHSGNHIIICTARGSLSGLDWSHLTKKQLKMWGVNYHELWFEKPYADFYIDDKAINDKDFEW